MSYAELLNKQEWKQKRQMILNRDDTRCQRCGQIHKGTLLETQILAINIDIELKEVLKLNNQFRVVYFKYKDYEIFAKTRTINNIIQSKQHFKLSWNLIKKKAQLNNNKFSMDGDILTFFELNKDKVNFSFIQYLKESNKTTINFNEYDFDIDGIYLFSPIVLDENKKNNFLNVHHKCYRENINIWDHNNNEYVTLCNICHSIIHETQNIPFFNANGQDYHSLSSCPRCGGKGYLHCYNHVQNGICFMCDGAGIIFPRSFLLNF